MELAQDLPRSIHIERSSCPSDKETHDVQPYAEPCDRHIYWYARGTETGQ